MLKYERDLLQIFLDNIPDTVYFKDTSSRFVRINRAQTKFLKLNDPEEAIGKTDLDFQPTDLAKQIMAEEKLIVESEEAIINRIEFNPTEDGIPRWLSATKVPVRNSSGTVVGTIGISRDVTEQRLAQEHEQNRRALLEKVIPMGQSVTEVKDLKTTLERIWHGIHDVLGFDRLAVFLYNAERNSMDSLIGTTIDGKMQDTSGIWFPIAGWTTFQMVLDKPDKKLSEWFGNRISRKNADFGGSYDFSVSRWQVPAVDRDIWLYRELWVQKRRGVPRCFCRWWVSSVASSAGISS